MGLQKYRECRVPKPAKHGIDNDGDVAALRMRLGRDVGETRDAEHDRGVGVPCTWIRSLLRVMASSGIRSRTEGSPHA